MLILVTGATGKVGRTLIDRLLADPAFGHARVRALCHNRALPASDRARGGARQHRRPRRRRGGDARRHPRRPPRHLQGDARARDGRDGQGPVLADRGVPRQPRRPPLRADRRRRRRRPLPPPPRRPGHRGDAAPRLPRLLRALQGARGGDGRAGRPPVRPRLDLPARPLDHGEGRLPPHPLLRRRRLRRPRLEDAGRRPRSPPAPAPTGAVPLPPRRRRRARSSATSSTSTTSSPRSSSPSTTRPPASGSSTSRWTSRSTTARSPPTSPRPAASPRSTSRAASTPPGSTTPAPSLELGWRPAYDLAPPGRGRLELPRAAGRPAPDLVSGISRAQAIARRPTSAFTLHDASEEARRLSRSARAPSPGSGRPPPGRPLLGRPRSRRCPSRGWMPGSGQRRRRSARQRRAACSALQPSPTRLHVVPGLVRPRLFGGRRDMSRGRGEQPSHDPECEHCAGDLGEDECRDVRGPMPLKLSERLRARVTAGLAKDVEAVNQ